MLTYNTNSNTGPVCWGRAEYINFSDFYDGNEDCYECSQVVVTESIFDDYNNFYASWISREDGVIINNTVLNPGDNAWSGLQIEYYGSVEMDGCTVYSGNGQAIYIYEYANLEMIDIHNTNIAPDGYDDYAVKVGCCGNEDMEIDMRGNYWGEALTDEMNEGDNPQNISGIYDWGDDNNRPVVNYAGWIGGPGDSGYTADVTLTDGSWNDIGNEYPAGTDTVYVEVYEPDESGSIEVTFISDSDTEGEVVTLSEVEAGLFRGFIPTFYEGFELLSDEDGAILLPGKIAELHSANPDWDDNRLERRARDELVREAIEVFEASGGDYHTPSVRDDGVLQVAPGDVMVVSYYDMLNDYGNEE